MDATTKRDDRETKAAGIEAPGDAAMPEVRETSADPSAQLHEFGQAGRSAMQGFAGETHTNLDDPPVAPQDELPDAGWGEGYTKSETEMGLAHKIEAGAEKPEVTNFDSAAYHARGLER